MQLTEIVHTEIEGVRISFEKIIDEEEGMECRLIAARIGLINIMPFLKETDVFPEISAYLETLVV